MATDRSLSVLKLFTLDRPVWTAEAISKSLEVSISTAYRYILGPAIIQLDRQLQLTDPLLQTSREIMERIATFAPDGSVVLLCRAFGDTVLCMHQVHARGPQSVVSYQRGKPMPMFLGATSRIILANQPLR